MISEDQPLDLSCPVVEIGIFQCEEIDDNQPVNLTVRRKRNSVSDTESDCRSSDRFNTGSPTDNRDKSPISPIYPRDIANHNDLKLQVIF